ncbi:hypothetical protein J1N35_045209, partial [Gossypium stocksii]
SHAAISSNHPWLPFQASDAGVVGEATEDFPGSFKYGMLAKRGKTPPSPPSPIINPFVHQLPEPPPAAPPST